MPGPHPYPPELPIPREAKPKVATVIVLGLSRGPKFEKTEPAIWGQTRGFYTPDGSPLKGSPGERSIFGEHFKQGVDVDTTDTALRCARQEFWTYDKEPLGRDDFKLLVADVETEKTINDVFLLKRLVNSSLLDIGEGDGLLRIPMYQLPWYIRDGHLTEASIKTLQAAGDIMKLWDML